VRRLAQAPLFTVLAVLTLAPGIGAHVAIFSLVNALFLRPLPVPDAGRVVGVYQTREGDGFFPLSLPDYADARSSTRVFSALASHYPTAPLQLAGVDGSTEINGSVVSGNYFSVLGVQPEVGRFFLPDDEAPGARPVAVVSHKLWRSRFGSRSDVAGQVLTINNVQATVVGVAPARFEGVLLGIPSDVWLPNSLAPAGYRWCDTQSRGCTWVSLIGRLAPGRTLEQAQAEMSALGRGLAAAHPETNKGLGLRATPLRGVHPSARPDTLRLAALLLAGVTLVVAVSCANLGSLLLLRGLTRRREIALRLALGASRRQIVSQLAAEAVLLALLGGAAGAVLGSWLGRVAALLYPSDVPLDLGLDLRALAYAFALALATGLIAGLVPALQMTRPSLVTALKEDAAASPGRPRLLGALIVVQVALSFVLITSTGLLARSASHAGRGGGIAADGVVTLRLRPRLIDATPQQGQAFSREALRRLAGLPGVQSVSLGVVIPPFQGDAVHVSLPGQPSGPEAPTATAGWIAPRLFATLGVPVLRGRDFNDHDTAGAAPVAIVNQTLSRRLWPDREALGRSLMIDGTAHEVVGLVPDLGTRTSLEPPAAQVYLPYWQNGELIDARLSIRAAGDPAALLPALRRELHGIDPRVPVTEAETLAETLGKVYAPVRVAGSVLGCAAGLALLLSTVGLYGLLSLAVAWRTRDIGVRLALGASRRQATSWVLRDAARLVAIALVLGLGAAVAAGRFLAHDLYGVSPRDPLIFGAALVLLALTASLASWLPARRASRIDPLKAIRQA
jgi:predicted permease